MSNTNRDKFYYRTEIVAGRTVHILKINLLDRGLKFVTNIPNLAIAPSQFAKYYKVTYAINADQFTYGERGTVAPAGAYAVNGQEFNPVGSDEPRIYISKKNEVSLKRPKEVWLEVSGNHILINNGMIVPVDEGYVFPRTAIGWSSKFNSMWWVVVDGVESEGTGISLSGLSIIMKSLGCSYAVNMDGGGSSVMVYRDKSDTVSVLSTPSDNNIVGRERSVANCLGVI